MEREDLEAVLRAEMRRHGERWGKWIDVTSDKFRAEYLGKLLVRRLVKEEEHRRYKKHRPEFKPEYQGDPEVMATKGPLGHTTGGGRRNIRGTDSLS